jgi:hypothetical protein
MAQRIKIADLAKEFGVENLRIFFPASKRDGYLGLVIVDASNPTQVVEGRAHERPHREVARDFKFIAEPLDKTFAHEDFYNGDFESLSETYPDSYYVMVGEQKYVLGFSKAQRAA